jgi:hypothetical protein
VIGVGGVAHAEEKAERDDGNESDHFGFYRPLPRRLGILPIFRHDVWQITLFRNR